MATKRLDITTEELFEQDILPGMEELWIDYASERYEINNPINLIETATLQTKEVRDEQAEAVLQN